LRKIVLFTSVFVLIALSIMTFYINNTTIDTSSEKVAQMPQDLTRVLYWGTRGEDVKRVQWTLLKWGYYDGRVDGIYGARTYRAVRRFQRKNGLAVDGVVGPNTAAAMGLSFGQRNTTAARGVNRNDNVYLLARAIYGEARGEPYIGQVAVGAVILNRVQNPKFPNSIASVVYQPGAFTAVSDGQINLSPDNTALRAARDALNGWDPTYGCLYYWNPAKARSPWIWSRKVVLKIGKHWFGK